MYKTMAALFLTSVAWSNNIPPRYQWNHNQGYCGEVSLISAGLYYGQYISQYDARDLATGSQSDQLLLGINDAYAADQMHLNYITWGAPDTDSFLQWVQGNVSKGYPVAIGVYTNEYFFYGNTDPSAGDDKYDHIVPVIGMNSNTITFSDNGLWTNGAPPKYLFSYSLEDFQANRQQANDPQGNVYSLSDETDNYGIAITGIKDLNGDTLPVRVDTNLNYESPEIEDGSNDRPAPMPLVLTVTVSNLEPGVLYKLYRYTDFSKVPNSEFNAHASSAFESWKVQINSGSTYVLTHPIQSDEQAIFRAVKATAP